MFRHKRKSNKPTNDEKLAEIERKLAIISTMQHQREAEQMRGTNVEWYEMAISWVQESILESPRIVIAENPSLDKNQ
jgi:hypothetical protein